MINTPARGIGKSTIDTIERLALETGLSLWGAIGEAIRRQLLPQRALSALKTFQQLILDAQAILSGTFAENLQAETERVGAGDSPAQMPEALQTLQASADEPHSDDAAAFDPNEFENTAFDFGGAYSGEEAESSAGVPPVRMQEKQEQASQPLPSQQDAGATTADILKFLIDRTGYIKLLEAEDTPEAFSRIENLRELVNAAMDSRDRGESLDQFLDHAALISDADDYDERSQITLMSLHAAKGLEFPASLSQRSRRGIISALTHHAATRRRRRRAPPMLRRDDPRHGPAHPDPRCLPAQIRYRPTRSQRPVAVPGRSANAVDRRAGRTPRACSTTTHVGTAALGRPAYGSDVHYSYEDEDQSANWKRSGVPASRQKTTAPAKPYNSIENIAEFFASRGKKFSVPKAKVEEPTGRRGFRPGQKVRHPKYGEGTVYQREGEGEEAKITVQFPRFGLKKLVEKYAQLERA